MLGDFVFKLFPFVSSSKAGRFQETIGIDREGYGKFHYCLSCSFKILLRYVSAYLSAYLSVCLSVCLSVYLSFCLSVCLSVCLYVCFDKVSKSDCASVCSQI